MYLNIINNISHESKKKKKTDYKIEHKKDEKENETNHIINDNDYFSYSSVFYGDLTKNWIKLTL